MSPFTFRAPLEELASEVPPCSGCFLGVTKLQTTFLTSTYLFGTCASWALLTVLAFQIHTYYTSSPNDGPYFKALVYGLMCIQTAETALVSYGVYYTDSLNWGNPKVILMVKAAIAQNVQPMLIGISAFTVQTFFNWRIWLFVRAAGTTQTKIIATFLCILIALASIVGLGTSFALIIVTFKFPGLLPHWVADVVTAWSLSSASADIIISICLVLMLFHARSYSISSVTRSKIARVIRLSIETGTVTTILAILLSVLDLKHIFGLYGLPAYLIGKSYVISFLANLNARQDPTVRGNSGSSPPAMATIKFTTPNRAGDERHSSFNLSSILGIMSRRGHTGGESEQTSAGSMEHASSPNQSMAVREAEHESKHDDPEVNVA